MPPDYRSDATSLIGRRSIGRNSAARRTRLNVEVRHLQYVLAAAEYGSFRRAAAALNIQESAISRRIRDLEDDIGVSLFSRTTAGVRLTLAGRRFSDRARAALEQISQALTDAASLGRGETGAVKIGIFSSFTSGFLAELLRRFIAAHPLVRVELSEGGPADHVAAVRRHELDVTFLTGTPKADGCEMLHLWDEGVLVALPATNVLAQETSIVWKQLHDATFLVTESDPGPEIEDYIVKHVADFGRHPRIERRGVGRENLLNLVAFGQGLTLISDAIQGSHFPGVIYRPLENELLPFSAIWCARNANPVLMRLLSLARSMSTNSARRA